MANGWIGSGQKILTRFAMFEREIEIKNSWDREMVKKKESDKIEGGDGRLNVWWG